MFPTHPSVLPHPEGSLLLAQEPSTPQGLHGHLCCLECPLPVRLPRCHWLAEAVLSPALPGSIHSVPGPDPAPQSSCRQETLLTFPFRL